MRSKCINHVIYSVQQATEIIRIYDYIAQWSDMRDSMWLTCLVHWEKGASKNWIEPDMITQLCVNESQSIYSNSALTCFFFCEDIRETFLQIQRCWYACLYLIFVSVENTCFRLQQIASEIRLDIVYGEWGEMRGVPDSLLGFSFDVTDFSRLWLGGWNDCWSRSRLKDLYVLVCMYN